jgi:hypothetical protein
MKKKSSRFVLSSNLMTALGISSLLAIVLFQAFSPDSFANASNRDEFPGRRQGGGTHWVLPTP